MTVRSAMIQSTRHNELIDITDEIAAVVRDMQGSAVLVYVPHTTAGVIINEHADPDVASDILAGLAEIVPAAARYRHVEGNSPAHIKATLVGTSQMIPLQGGRLLLGTWQGVFLAEFDGPRTRRVLVVPIA